MLTAFDVNKLVSAAVGELRGASAWYTNIFWHELHEFLRIERIINFKQIGFG